MNVIRTIVCYGDSNTHGADAETQARLPRTVRWPGVVRSELSNSYEVIEEGLNGRTSVFDHRALPFRNGADYLLPCLWSHAPVDLLVIMLGTNDLKSRYKVGAEEVAASVAYLVDLARRSLAGPDQLPPRVLLVCPPPLGPISAKARLWGFGQAEEESRRLAPLLQLAAEIRGVPFLDAGSIISSSTIDGVHLDPAAHQGLGREVSRQIRSIFASD